MATGKTIKVDLSFDSTSGRILVDGTPYGEAINVAKIVAPSLDAATLCDIIMEWLGADCNWGEFEKELHSVVEKYGSFE